MTIGSDVQKKRTDTYKEYASIIFEKPPTEITYRERLLAKRAHLAHGYMDWPPPSGTQVSILVVQLLKALRMSRGTVCKVLDEIRIPKAKAEKLDKLDQYFQPLAIK